MSHDQRNRGSTYVFQDGVRGGCLGSQRRPDNASHMVHRSPLQHGKGVYGSHTQYHAVQHCYPLLLYCKLDHAGWKHTATLIIMQIRQRAWTVVRCPSVVLMSLARHPSSLTYGPSRIGSRSTWLPPVVKAVPILTKIQQLTAYQPREMQARSFQSSVQRQEIQRRHSTR